MSIQWGERVRYLTDDRDERHRHELMLELGGNGDWYLSVLPEGHRIGPAVRLSTSGGADRVPELTWAVARLYRALYLAAGGENAPPLEEPEPLPPLAGPGECVCPGGVGGLSCEHCGLCRACEACRCEPDRGEPDGSDDDGN